MRRPSNALLVATAIVSLGAATTMIACDDGGPGSGSNCGNDTRDAGELCDGSDLDGESCTSVAAELGVAFNGGQLACNETCNAWDTSGCTSPDLCGNGAIDGSEACDTTNFGGADCTDFGFATGELLCTAQCTVDSTGCSGTSCGNGTIDASEDCDGNEFGGTTCVTLGYDSGTLFCTGLCTLDESACLYSCGDGTLQTDIGEECDGANLGGQTCQARGFTGGTLACGDDCRLDDAGCTNDNCGNGTIQPADGEECDGTSFAGATCVTRGHVGGVLACSARCRIDETGCTDCGDGVIQTAAGELCDGLTLGGLTCGTFGFVGGTLACNATCDGFVDSGCVGGSLCGDDRAQGSEVCDGTDVRGQDCASRGFGPGTLACAADCTAFATQGCSGNGPRCDGAAADPGEVCDGTNLRGVTCASLGLGGGTLGCAVDCLSYDVGGCVETASCGDGVTTFPEPCDGTDLGGATCTSQGFNGGTLTCTSACRLDHGRCLSGPACGDGVRDPSEDCDGDDLGGATCASRGFAGGGTLACNAACTFDTSACASGGDACGDGVYGSYWCDGGSFVTGSRSCAGFGLGSGDLACDADCAVDFSGCATPLDVCAQEGWYGDGLCDPCELMGGISDVDCDDCGQAGDGCIEYVAASSGLPGDWTCGRLGTRDPDCLPACGNGSLDGIEACDGGMFADVDGDGSAEDQCSDWGYAGGVVGCASDCTLDFSGCTAPICNDGTVQGWELCDGTHVGGVTCESLGLPAGTLVCNAACNGLDVSGCNQCACDATAGSCTPGCGCDPDCGPRCGNGDRDPGENCDGADLNGVTCQVLGFIGGTLGCRPNCSFDTTGCQAAVCGNNVVEGSEWCDGTNLNGYDCQAFGYSSGTLTCTQCIPNTSGCFDTCGNGAIDAGESCDGSNLGGASCAALGYFGGTLTCGGNCQLDFARCHNCGNGSRDTGEACDGQNLGGATCPSLGFGSGVLGCSGVCTFDTHACFGGVTGAACRQDTDCGSGLCLDEIGTGVPGGMCVTACNAGTCSDPNQDCTQVAGASVCVPRCTSFTDCRPGYSCLDRFSVEPTCYPDCLSDDDCPDSALCNVWSGLCEPESGDGHDGDPCSSNADCEGDFCATASSYGLPGGYCLSMCSQETEACPGGGVCLPFFAANYAAACGASCTSRSDCRAIEGYDCIGGACLPGLCGNNAYDGFEACDGTNLFGYTCDTLGLPPGVLRCTGDCVFDTSLCGCSCNINPSSCDAGCACDPQCSAVCGDGVAVAPEDCDGTDLSGTTCLSLGYSGGILACNAASCTFDTNRCTGTPQRQVSEACKTDSECLGGLCLDETSTGFPGGFCSKDCSSVACPSGSGCIDFGLGPRCVVGCDVTTDCRVGYACAETPESILPMCVPNCNDDSECPDTSVCNVYTGLCEPDGGRGHDGDACATASACESGFDCLTGAWRGGTCTSLCASDDLRCPGDGVCLNLYGNNQAWACIDGCTRDADCRTSEEYACVTGACVPGSPVVCGNDVVGAGEDCDGLALGGETCVSLGFSGGALACGPTCLFDTAGCFSGCPCDVTTACDSGCACDSDCARFCGDGIIDATESCDSADLAGADCESLGFSGGRLFCDPVTCGYNTDACVLVANVGDACAAGAECASGLCLDEASAGFPGGACVADCGADPCGAGEVCTQFAASIYFCLPGCTASADCRDGYSCFDGAASAPVCLPNCMDDAECPGTGSCNPWSGYCTPDRSLGRDGEPCADSTDCESGFVCIDTASGWLGGYCTSLCAADEAACPGDGVCTDLLGLSQSWACLDGCTSDAECRVAEGYGCIGGTCAPACGCDVSSGCDAGCACDADCFPTCGDGVIGIGEECDGANLAGKDCVSLGFTSGALACGPACFFDTSGCAGGGGTAPTGEACDLAGDCASGQCLSEGTFAWPGGFCTGDCTATGTCAAGEECVDFGGVSFCMSTCATSLECRAGYSCFAGIGSVNPFCYPDCVTSVDCPDSGTCNPYTGFCYDLFGLGADGEACSGDVDCESGFCLTQGQGFPGGSCTSLCDPAANTCAPGDACYWDLGVSVTFACAAGCTTDTDCRLAEGYTCQGGGCNPF